MGGWGGGGWLLARLVSASIHKFLTLLEIASTYELMHSFVWTKFFCDTQNTYFWIIVSSGS